MSLTSYRAAPPRVNFFNIGEKQPALFYDDLAMLGLRLLHPASTFYIQEKPWVLGPSALPLDGVAAPPRVNLCLFFDFA